MAEASRSVPSITMPNDVSDNRRKAWPLQSHMYSACVCDTSHGVAGLRRRMNRARQLSVTHMLWNGLKLYSTVHRAALGPKFQRSSEGLHTPSVVQRPRESVAKRTLVASTPAGQQVKLDSVRAEPPDFS